MKITTKLILGFGIVVLLLGIVGGIGWYSVRLGDLKTAELHDQESLMQDVLRTRTMISDAETNSFASSLYREEEYEQNTAAELEKMEALLTEIKPRFRAENQERIDRIIEQTQIFGRVNSKLANNEIQMFKIQEEQDAVAEQMTDKLEELREKLSPEKDSALIFQILDSIQHVSEIRLLSMIFMASGTEEERIEIKKKIEPKAKLVKADLDELAKTLDMTEPNAASKDLVKFFDEWLNKAERIYAIDTHSWKLDVELDEAKETILEISDEMMAAQQKRIAQLRDDGIKLVRKATILILSFSALAALIAIVIGYTLTSGITTGIGKAATFLTALAQEGDLSRDIPESDRRRRDEIGTLAKAAQMIVDDYHAVERLAQELASGNWRINVKAKGDHDAVNINLSRMIEQVNGALKNTAEAIDHVAGGAAQVASSSESLSQGATESAASIEEITASMGEIGGQTKQNAQNATEANSLAKSASNAATAGREMMQKMIVSMEGITKNAQNIQNVVKVIDDISFQTNLLALNAAVEAARAGVHGKGFAVVAEEVRNLASRSAKAAAETTGMIENNGRQISAGAEIAIQTAEMLNGIVEQVTKVTEIIGKIAVASNEQAQNVSQVSHGLHQIDAVTQQNTASAEESASVTAEMSQEVAKLQQLIGQFRVK